MRSVSRYNINTYDSRKIRESKTFPKIRDAYINELSVGSDVYYYLDGEVNFDMGYDHVGLIDDFYTNGARTIITIFDDNADLMYSVLEFNSRDKMIASESFKDSFSAKKFFKEII
jgi:hypothetical protein